MRKIDPRIGRDENLFGKDQDLWIDSVLEIEPQTGQTVWEWHLYDHVIPITDESVRLASRDILCGQHHFI